METNGTCVVSQSFVLDEFIRLFLTVKIACILYILINEYRLMVVSDISCDIRGGIEFMLRPTTIDAPTFDYDPVLKQETTNKKDDVVTVMGVDILPTELPMESSTHFGTAVSDILQEMATAYLENHHNEKDDGTTLKADKLSPHLVCSF